VGFPVLEEPSVRGGRDETKTSKNNDCNQNSYSERNHAAPLVLAVLRQHTAMTNQTDSQEAHYAYRFSTKYPKGGR
jgi:hypothetical protein